MEVDLVGSVKVKTLSEGDTATVGKEDTELWAKKLEVKERPGKKATGT